jgi:hypothetical protein
MGTWSTPLFATVSPGTPEDYEIVLSDLSETLVNEWKHVAFFKSGAPTYTLTEFMNTGCDTHKIMDHMNNDQIRRWLSLFSYLAKKYPSLNEVAFHFYCSDEHKAYSFRWDRTKHGDEPNVLYMHVGSYDSVYYFTIDPEHPRRRIFHRDMYEKYWTILPHETYKLVYLSRYI